VSSWRREACLKCGTSTLQCTAKSAVETVLRKSCQKSNKGIVGMLCEKCYIELVEVRARNEGREG